MAVSAKQWENINNLCDLVRETSFAIHKFLCCGHLEKVCENALVHRLRKQGLEVEQQFPLKVHDEDGTTLGEYFADLYVEGCLIVELKACKAIATSTLPGYLDTWPPHAQKLDCSITSARPDFMSRNT
ncbi:MAG: GxxExxY protein [Planctomycetales bacterium]|nr:GxxExxY protein [Planctomycetales bacterium]